MKATKILATGVLILAALSLQAWAIEPVSVSDRAVVLNPERASQMVKQCSRRSPTEVSGSWMPTLGDITLIEKALPQFIAHRARLHRPASAYCRQYVGLISRGRKIIYVNALLASEFKDRDPDAIDWKKEPVVVCDGGGDAWGVEFDPHTNRFHNFAVNGTP